MSNGDAHKQILFVAAKKEAQPVLGQLRGAGHRVSLVEDLDEAQELLQSGGFDQAILSARALGALLTKVVSVGGLEPEEWRRSVSALTYDLDRLLEALNEALATEAGAVERDGLRASIGRLCDYLKELTEELTESGSQLHLSLVSVEDAIETAAVSVYPSAATRRQRLVIDVDESVAVVRTDAPKFKRVIASLLRYASAHTPPSGSVKVRVRVDSRQGVVAISFDGGELSRSELAELFTRNVESDDPGSLSRVQRLVERVGARVWLESEKGAETTVFLALPSWSLLSPDRVSQPIDR